MARLIVGIGEVAASHSPDDEIKTFALGSCIALIFLDPKTRVAGLAHFALPESAINPAKAAELPCYFVDTGIPFLLKKMHELGSTAHSGYITKIIGGASVIKDNDQFMIGERNVTAAKKALWALNLPITALDVGKNFSRTVTIVLKTGKISISSSNGETWSI